LKYLIDTCVLSELIKKQPNRSVVAWIQEQDEPALFLSVLTFGELEKGIAKLGDCRRTQQLRDWVDHDLKRRFGGRILPVDYETACRWGSISSTAEKAGTPMPVIDSILAATALTHGLTLVTRNTSDVAASNVPLLNPWSL
jgi:predicted nucleic acid-binding protein